LQVGSKYLRAHMHGFFMDARLHAEALAVAEPFAYEEYRKRRVERILEEGTARRFELKKAARTLPKVSLVPKGISLRVFACHARARNMMLIVCVFFLFFFFCFNTGECGASQASADRKTAKAEEGEGRGCCSRRTAAGALVRRSFLGHVFRPQL
jgi:hypothetical protein